MDTVNEIVLESAVVILSGGTDRSGVPLITFPADSDDLLDIYHTVDILKLLQVFTDLCKGQVSVVADLKQGWTEDCIEKFAYLLDELQTSRNGCLKTAYLVKPCVRRKNRHLHRQLSRVNDRGTTFQYEIRKVENYQELYRYIDKSQLTADYGGTLNYNHIAWVDFQRTFIPVILDVKRALHTMPSIKNQLSKFNGKKDKNFSENRDQELTKYQDLLNAYGIRQSISNCQNAIERLEHPECDPNLLKTHPGVLNDTMKQLQSLHGKLANELSDMDTIMNRSNAEHAVFSRLEECSKNTTEVEDTIDLMRQHLTELPMVGEDEEQAKTNRDNFIDSILTPSEDIVSCAKSILNDLECGEDTTSTSYVVAIEIAQRLTDSLLPFTEQLNQLNETYTRIYLFYVIYNKTIRWKNKSITFLSKVLCEETRTKSSDDSKGCAKTHESISEINARKSEVQKENEISNFKDSITDSEKLAGGNKMYVIAPVDWETHLQSFYLKHPPPKKKHVKLLDKHVPVCIQGRQRNQAETLAERVLFILQMLRKSRFKCEDLLLVQTWSDQKNLQSSLVTFSDVTFV